MRGLWLPLPWLLTTTALEEINSIRRAISLTLGPRPSAEGEGASSLQLRLMRLSVAQRPPLSASQSAAAVAAATATQSPPRCVPAETPAEFLPPIRMQAFSPSVSADGVPAMLGAQTAATTEGGAPPDEEDMLDWDEDEDEPLELLNG